MGRTLHYKVLNPEAITEEEKEIMYRISLKYNSGDFEDVWTCESFWLDPWDYYPNWDFYGKHKPFKEAWADVEKRYAELASKGLSRREITGILSRRFIRFYSEGEIEGFCKVGGNEFNAFLVLTALVEITKKTKARISLHDEGELLYGSITLHNGKARWDKRMIRSQWKYWKEKGFLEGNKYGLAEKKARQEQLFYVYEGYVDPFLLCRPIKKEDFENHPEYGATEIMAGFDGEYWGLSDTDHETASLNFCALIKKLIEGTEMTLEVAPKLT